MWSRMHIPNTNKNSDADNCNCNTSVPEHCNKLAWPPSGWMHLWCILTMSAWMSNFESVICSCCTDRSPAKMMMALRFRPGLTKIYSGLPILVWIIVPPAIAPSPLWGASPGPRRPESWRPASMPVFSFCTLSDNSENCVKPFDHLFGKFPNII